MADQLKLSEIEFFGIFDGLEGSSEGLNHLFGLVLIECSIRDTSPFDLDFLEDFWPPFEKLQVFLGIIEVYLGRNEAWFDFSLDLHDFNKEYLIDGIVDLLKELNFIRFCQTKAQRSFDMVRL